MPQALGRGWGDDFGEIGLTARNRVVDRRRPPGALGRSACQHWAELALLVHFDPAIVHAETYSSSTMNMGPAVAKVVSRWTFSVSMPIGI